MRCLLFYRQPYCQKHNSLQSGFTLIELLLIIVLIGVLAIAAINAFEGNEEQARLNITRLEMAELQKALLQYRQHTRELPCRVYRDGIYNPLQFEADFGASDFSNAYDLPSLPATAAQWHSWCRDRSPADLNKPAKTTNALFMVNTFPYQATAHGSLFWDRDRQSGWNGPYVTQEALTDGWGKPYQLLDPELDYNQSFFCQEDGATFSQLAIDGTTGQYRCLSVTEGALPADFTIPANIARIISAGPNGQIESATSGYDLDTQDPCVPVPDSDDLVLCLLR